MTPKAGHPTGIVLAQYLQFMGCVEETVKQLQYVLFPGFVGLFLLNSLLSLLESSIINPMQSESQWIYLPQKHIIPFSP